MPRIQQVLLPGVFVAVVIVIVFTSQISSASAAQIPNPPATSQADAVQSPLPTSVPQSDCGLSIRFPDGIRQWCSLIGNYAQKYGLESQLIAAVMLQESGGDPNAYSPSGAVGLMQVMPRDGLAADFLCNGRPCFSARPAMADLFDPEFNISYGVRMLAGLIQKYGGVRDALRAYGPSDAGYSYADKVLAIYQNYQ